MKLNHGLHLAYCTNIHRGETWAETFESLETHALAVRERVCPSAPFGLGLRLGHRAAQELSDRTAFLEFQRWLDLHQCYVFTINGFPYGQFHGARVKEQVYRPDWTTPERLAYTNRLFDLLAQLVPAGVEGSVSTLPGSFKEFVHGSGESKSIRDNLWRCVEHIARLSQRTGHALHLGLEPEPLCLLETSGETIRFFDRFRDERRDDPRLDMHLGVTYDTCHFAVEFEEPGAAIASLRQHGIKLSKIHLSNAMTVHPTVEALAALRAFADDVYLHQVVVRRADGRRMIYRDLPDALAREAAASGPQSRVHGPESRVEELPNDKVTPHSVLRTPHSPEWRVHFHIPLHSPPAGRFGNTTEHLLGALDVLAANPALCPHLEMETYTWEVLPPELKSRSVTDQLESEYEWTLERLTERGLAGA